jgi:replicative DNA helicase
MEKIDYEKIIIGKLLLLPKRSDQLDVLCELDGVPFVNYKRHLDAISKTILSGRHAGQVEMYSFGGFDLKQLDDIMMAAGSTGFDISNTIGDYKVEIYKNNLVYKLESYLKEIKDTFHYEDIEENKNALLADLNGMGLGDKAEFISIKEYKEKIKSQLGSTNEIEGYSWGIEDLNKFTSGIVVPRLCVIGGLKKSGKTRFVIHSLKQLHEQGIPAAFLSMEMPAYEVVKLLHSAFMGINDLQFRSGSFLSQQQRDIFESLTIDEKLISIECRSGLNIAQTLSRLRKYAKLGYKVVFIDYLQRIASKGGNRADELESYSIKIADAARQSNLGIILLSQLNAGAENDVPNMGSLKGSGGIGEAADTILLLDNLYRRSKKETDKNCFDIYIEQRYGDSGRISIKADLGSCYFNNIERFT